MGRYLLGSALGAAVGILSAFFALCGLRGRKLLPRLLNSKVRWPRAALVMILLAAAIGCWGVFVYGGVGRDFAGCLLLAGYLLSVSFTDLRRRAIPDDATLTFGALFLLYQAAGLELTQLLFALFGGLAGAVLLGIPHLVRRESVGLGDVKLLACCGLVTGFPGCLYLLIRGLIALALTTLILLLLRRVKPGDVLPLAPFLLVGALI